MSRRIAQAKPARNGRSGKRSRKGNPLSGPSQCGFEHWTWLPAEVIEAILVADLSRDALRALFRLLLEHIGQGGASNGELTCTYGDFQAAGVPRSRIPKALSELERGGFIRVRRNGRIAGHSRPNHYRLTWAGAWHADGIATIPPSNEWRAAKNDKIWIEGAGKAGNAAV